MHHVHDGAAAVRARTTAVNCCEQARVPALAASAPTAANACVVTAAVATASTATAGIMLGGAVAIVWSLTPMAVPNHGNDVARLVHKLIDIVGPGVSIRGRSCIHKGNVCICLRNF
jgi:hypothetical protein